MQSGKDDGISCFDSKTVACSKGRDRDYWYLLNFETSKVTSAKVERFVHSFILILKVVVEVPEGEAEETRLHKKVQPLQSLILQKSNLKI